MDPDQLHRILAKLHDELATADSVDDESRALLKTLAGDVERLAGETETTAEEHESATDQLNELAVRFESEHPKLSHALGEVVDALGRLGI